MQRETERAAVAKLEQQRKIREAERESQKARAIASGAGPRSIESMAQQARLKGAGKYGYA
jgi:hypothetical protein